MTNDNWQMENGKWKIKVSASRYLQPFKRVIHASASFAQKNNGGETLASVPSVFLRPFSGCVPQPEKKRRLFDSHKSKFPHGCRIDGHYIKAAFG
jgi:hypothetical protein